MDTMGPAHRVLTAQKQQVVITVHEISCGKTGATESVVSLA